MPPRDRIDRDEADIVPVLGKAQPWIAEPDDKTHWRGGLPQASSAGGGAAAGAPGAPGASAPSSPSSSGGAAAAAAAPAAAASAASRPAEEAGGGATLAAA